MAAGYRTRVTQREVFCEVVACIGDALGEMEVGRIRQARDALNNAMQWATLHPAFDDAVTPVALNEKRVEGLK